MMHKLIRVTLLLTLIAVAFSANAQSKAPVLKRNPAIPKVRPELMKPVTRAKAVTGFELQNQQNTSEVKAPSVPQSQSMLRSALTEERAGDTKYDIQTNGSPSPHLYAWPNGEVTAAWTMSKQIESLGWPDRGSGYNSRTNWTMSTPIYPTARLESVRTGFTNYVVTESGTELVIAHTGAGALNTMRRTSSSIVWQESTIPSTVACLWPKAAVDGENVYVIALSTPASLGGAPYLGMDGHVLFWRSPDGGATWDITAGVVPGLDSSAFAAISADVYSIDARDGQVAIGLFDSFNDAKVFKSFDGGNTWDDPILVFDFPLDKYKIDDGYTTNDIPFDEDAPDTLAIFTTDGSCALVLDQAGFVHVWAGEMYVQDLPGDGASSYYPGTNGLIYWSEFDTETLYEITGSLDFDGNDTLDFNVIDNIGYGGFGLSSMPSAGVDANGGLYLAYSAGVERLEDLDGNNYRHIYVMKSPDYGTTWFWPPVDLNYATDTDPDSNLSKISEGVYPSCYNRVNDKFHISYQRDLTPGASVIKSGNQDGEGGEIIYVGNADVVGIKDVTGNDFEMSISPNPVSDGFAQLVFNLKQAGETQVEITDMRGALLRRTQYGMLNAGPNYLPLSTSGLQNGLYFVRVQSGNREGTKKLVVLNR